MLIPDPLWIDAFTDVVHDTMRRCKSPANCCVEAACVGVGVAKAFGYLVEPVPVSVQVVAGRHATILPGPDGRRRSGFDGHLVLYFATAGILADPTADQFHAPKRGLHVPPTLTAPVPRDVLVAGVAAELPGGTTIIYREMVGDVSWRSLPAWAEPSALTTLIATRELREALSASSRRHPTRHG
jgi:hypothetical protein